MNTMISDLQELERVIDAKRGTESFYEIGKALEKIRDAKLYKEDHKNFNFYCRERWDMAHRTAYQFIAAAVVIDHLCDFDVLPINEAQARPLTRLLPDQQIDVWGIVLEQDQPITAKRITQIVAEYIGIDHQPKPKPKIDDSHIKYPQEGEFFEAIREARESVMAVQKSVFREIWEVAKRTSTKEEKLKLLSEKLAEFDWEGFTNSFEFDVNPDSGYLTFSKRCSQMTISLKLYCWPDEERHPNKIGPDDILGIPADSTVEVATQARDRLLSLYHPDEFAKYDDREFGKMAEIKRANILKAYDQYLKWNVRHQPAQLRTGGD